MFDVQKKNKQENNKRGKQSHSAGMQESKWGEGERGRSKQISKQANKQPHKQPTKRSNKVSKQSRNKQVHNQTSK